MRPTPRGVPGARPAASPCCNTAPRPHRINKVLNHSASCSSGGWKDQDQDEEDEEKEKRSRKKASELRIHRPGGRPGDVAG